MTTNHRRQERSGTARDHIETGRCHFCPKQTDIEAHHIVPKRFGGSDDRENIVGVCDRCHAKLEALYDKRFYERLGMSDETGERHAHFDCLLADCSNQAEVRAFGMGEWFCVDCLVERAEDLIDRRIERQLGLKACSWPSVRWTEVAVSLNLHDPIDRTVYEVLGEIRNRIDREVVL